MVKRNSYLSLVLHKATFSLIISLLFSSISWLWGIISGHHKGFFIPFIAGAIGIYVCWTILGLISTIINLIRFKKDPLFEKAHLTTGLDWWEYKSLRKQETEKLAVSRELFPQENKLEPYEEFPPIGSEIYYSRYRIGVESDIIQKKYSVIDHQPFSMWLQDDEGYEKKMSADEWTNFVHNPLIKIKVIPPGDNL